MDAKWPLLIITVGLLIGVGVLIVSMDRDTVMRNWKTRRCEIPVMFASVFFKPDDDPRTSFDFGTANFQFCMKSYVDRFMENITAPTSALFGKQANLTANVMDMLQSVRTIAANMFAGFSVYLAQFYRRFNASVFEISKIIQFLRMAMRRISAVAMSFIYMGISLFNGMLNSIQFIIRVVLIICGIMVAIMIILFFILFPVIPLILATLGIIATTVFSLTGLISPTVASEANAMKGPFCFAEWTQMSVIENGQQRQKPIAEIQIGDQLSDGSYITAVIVMDGLDVPLYQIGSVYVSGSHLVKGTDKQWKSVTEDARAVISPRLSRVVYCFNTTTNVITIDGLQFRDWEEIANDDIHGQIIWNYMVSSILHRDRAFGYWKDNLKNYVNVALLGPDVPVKTLSGYIPIHTIKIGDFILDRRGNEQEVRGIIRGEVEYDATRTIGSAWKTELYEYVNSLWLKGVATVYPGIDKTEGYSLITEEGIIIIKESDKELCVRDFTEIGYQHLYKTYSYVEARLRMKE